jgi:GntR family transcriptional repressor for pyruvate dehydrogenase complex
VFINELVPIILKPDDQLEIMEFRKALEIEALRLAAQRATREDLLELERIHHNARKAFKNKELETYFKEDMQFHMQIFRMSKNSLFASTVQTLGSLLFQHFYSVAKDFFETRAVPSDDTDLHTIILNALKAGDIEKCIATYSTLIDELISMYHQLLKKRPKT